MQEVFLETKHIAGTERDEGDALNQQLNTGTSLVGRYVIQEVIGVGGMGSVYRARDLHFPNVVKLVAVKEMIIQSPDPLVRKTIVQNFEREANILATLSHPAIPRIYDYFTNENRSYLVLEFVNGKDLETIINEQQGFMPEEQVLRWAIELCDVLGYLHNHKPEPIIFRDMKPSNVMINTSGSVILVDFGIAKPFQSGQKGTMIGTEGYSPPEQYRGEATPQADIYSLGATLHHLLTKRDPRIEPPFSFSERPPTKINPAISSEFETVINTALEYNPEDRFESIDAMKEALLKAGQRTGMLNRLPASATGMQSGALKPLWIFECEDEIRGTPLVYDGLVFTGSYDHNVYAVNASTGELVWKYPTEGGIVTRPATFDGNIFITSEDQRLHVVSARSGKIVWSYYANSRIRSSPRISDGHVFFGSDDNRLHAVNINSGRAAWIFETAAPVRSTPFVSNEAVFVGCESGEFYSIDFRGELKWRFKAKLAITSSPIEVERVIYFNSLDASLYALESKNGWVIWRFRMGKGSIVSPSVTENLIFTGSADGFIYGVDTRSGKELWRFRTEHQVSGSPVIYKDAIYCGAADGYLYCLEYTSGRMRWKFQTKGPITSAPSAFDDVIYVGSSDNTLYALLA